MGFKEKGGKGFEEKGEWDLGNEPKLWKGTGGD